MLKVGLSVVFLLALMGMICDARSSGPPVSEQGREDLCSSMMPSHGGASPQSAPSPYIITLSNTCYRDGQSILVTIKASNDWKISGFFLQARNGTNDGRAFGSFDAGQQNGVQALACFGESQSAIGHSAKGSGSEVEFTWSAPSGIQTDLHFRATVVNSFAEFWVGVNSSEIRYSPGCEEDINQYNKAGFLQGQFLGVLLVTAVLLWC